MAKPFIHDKAKYHINEHFPEELSPFQAHVHTGMFLGWIIDHQLYSKSFERDGADEIIKFHKRELTGSQIYELYDGVFDSDMLSSEGHAFAMAYFDFDNGSYLNDYCDEVFTDLKSVFHVEDTWDNYDKLKEVIDRRYSEWINK
ncbi:hypothetical protein PCCS19_12630 [Paenibacillus sp. CCS19]|uniref:DUF7832 domain-containing protein n=1 Tax=Paenibacillus sp. CCS19 TaxID=3158387 RepID=UPI002565868B|nr:hypothetical protein [Paenibacillus cellulosilyticus]GMK38209.1 hypothetical protein PCCS19_12630 [Paenibacillus cellulosilyticus]